MIVLPSSSEVSLLVFYITYVYSAWAKFRTEKTVVILEICDKLNYEKNYKQCAKKIKEITNNKPLYKWENMDVLTNDNLPLIGRISSYEKNVFIDVSLLILMSALRAKKSPHCG